MASLVSALDTEFTPAVGDFNVQVTGGNANLLRKNSTALAWALVTDLANRALVVSNPVAGAVYKFTAATTTPVVQADQ